MHERKWPVILLVVTILAETGRVVEGCYKRLTSPRWAAPNDILKTRCWLGGGERSLTFSKRVAPTDLQKFQRPRSTEVVFSPMSVRERPHLSAVRNHQPIFVRQRPRSSAARERLSRSQASPILLAWESESRLLYIAGTSLRQTRAAFCKSERATKYSSDLQMRTITEIVHEQTRATVCPLTGRIVLISHTKSSPPCRVIVCPLSK